MVRCCVVGERYIAAAMTAQVIGCDAELVSKHGYQLQVPDSQIAGEAMEHHHIRPLAYTPVMDVDVIYENL